MTQAEITHQRKFILLLITLPVLMPELLKNIHIIISIIISTITGVRHIRYNFALFLLFFIIFVFLLPLYFPLFYPFLQFFTILFFSEASHNFRVFMIQSNIQSLLIIVLNGLHESFGLTQHNYVSFSIESAVILPAGAEMGLMSENATGDLTIRNVIGLNVLIFQAQLIPREHLGLQH